MLILEGGDSTGKTTLAKRLLKELPRHIYCHFSRLPPAFDYYWDYCDRMSRYVVQDRFHLSELVYAKVRGVPTNLNPETYRLVDAQLRVMGAYVVKICAAQSLIEKRWDKTQMYSFDETLYANRLYDSLSKFTEEGYKIDVDYTFHCYEDTPYVTEDAIAEILAGYRARQRNIDLINRQRTT